MSSYLESFSKWLQLKIYQFEVTLSVYIYTPIEKFVICTSPPSVLSAENGTRALPLTIVTDSGLFLLFSLTFIATTLYLPQHLQFIFSRAWFYVHGDSPETLAEAAKEVSRAIAKTAMGTATASMAAMTDAASVVREL